MLQQVGNTCPAELSAAPGYRDSRHYSTPHQVKSSGCLLTAPILPDDGIASSSHSPSTVANLALGFIVTPAGARLVDGAFALRDRQLVISAQLEPPFCSVHRSTPLVSGRAYQTGDNHGAAASCRAAVVLRFEDRAHGSDDSFPASRGREIPQCHD
jgi:hypothetical protein